MIRRWVLHVEAHRGRWPIVHLHRDYWPGDRLVEGGVPGTLVRCPECGDGLLHRPDGTPPRAAPSEGPPWRGVAVGFVESVTQPGGRAPLWTSSRVVGPDVVHRAMKTGLAEGRCQDRSTCPDGYGVLSLLDADGDVIGEYAVPDKATFWWWARELDLRTTPTGEATS